MQSLDLKKQIQIRTGDYRRKWVDAKIVYVSMEDVEGEDEFGKSPKGLSFSVEFVESGETYTQCLTDAFGWNSDNWRYKEKCCELCKWREKDGGDAVPYGSTVAYLPECTYCVCPNATDDEIVNLCETTEYGKTCNYHEFKE